MDSKAVASFVETKSEDMKRKAIAAELDGISASIGDCKETVRDVTDEMPASNKWKKLLSNVAKQLKDAEAKLDKVIEKEFSE